jgi:hypothetical protein
MGQLVEADQRNLRALPLVDRGVELQMRELDLAAVFPAPFVGAVERVTAEPRIKVQALVPQPAGVGDLRGGAPKEYGAEARYSADMAQWLENQSYGLAAAGGAAIDADVRGSL